MCWELVPDSVGIVCLLCCMCMQEVRKSVGRSSVPPSPFLLRLPGCANTQVADKKKKAKCQKEAKQDEVDDAVKDDVED